MTCTSFAPLTTIIASSCSPVAVFSETLLAGVAGSGALPRIVVDDGKTPTVTARAARSAPVAEATSTQAAQIATIDETPLIRPSYPKGAR